MILIYWFYQVRYLILQDSNMQIVDFDIDLIDLVNNSIAFLKNLIHIPIPNF